MYTARESERKSEESICDERERERERELNSEMQMKTIGKPAWPAEVSVRGSQSIEVVRKSCLVASERQYVNKDNKCENQLFFVFYAC